MGGGGRMSKQVPQDHVGFLSLLVSHESMDFGSSLSSVIFAI